MGDFLLFNSFISLSINLIFSKVIISHRYEFCFIFYDFFVLLRCLVLYRCFIKTFCFSLSYYNILFMYNDSNEKSIFDQIKTINQIMVFKIIKFISF